MKDISELHVTDPEHFTTRLHAAMDAAIPWNAHAAHEADTTARDAWALCEPLATQAEILSHFAARLTRAGYAGDPRAAELVYLTLTSRLLDRPVSAVLKGPSSAGKSYTVESTTRFFPPEAYYALTAMSDRALAYDDEPLVHRTLIIYEAAGAASETATYMLRSLLSEGHIRYVTVQKTSEGLRPLTIERDGPTGVILTTTAVRLHPENETRLLSIPLADTREQTSAVLRAIASDETPAIKYEVWRALQTWLATQDNRVVIPFAGRLAELVPPVAVRLRRDFGQLLALIRAHAVLHQATRERDAAGRIVATLDDYAVVRELVADLVAEGIEATVSPATRETVAAVEATLAGDPDGSVSVAQLASTLKLDKGAVSRRVATAVERGYLKNLEERRGRPARIVLGDPLPDDLVILPTRERLAECCSVDVLMEGINHPPPSASANGRHRCSGCGEPFVPRDPGETQCRDCLDALAAIQV